MTREPCEVCPVSVGTCWGLSHPPACDLVRSGQPGRAEQLIAMAAGQPTPDRGPVDARLAMLADLCPSGSGECGCGLAPRLCGREDRPLHVWRTSHCLPCVTPIILGDTP